MAQEHARTPSEPRLDCGLIWPDPPCVLYMFLCPMRFLSFPEISQRFLKYLQLRCKSMLQETHCWIPANKAERLGEILGRALALAYWALWQHITVMALALAMYEFFVNFQKLSATEVWGQPFIGIPLQTSMDKASVDVGESLWNRWRLIGHANLVP